MSISRCQIQLILLLLLPVSVAFGVTDVAGQEPDAPRPVADVSPAPAATPVAMERLSLCGQWNGSWVSCKNGHNGKLRATFCRINDCQVEAVFVGSFAKILPFRYKAVLDIVHEEPGMIQLRGSKKLGPIMGSFSYDATITGNQFSATYRSKRDCGQWSMTRCN